MIISLNKERPWVNIAIVGAAKLETVGHRIDSSSENRTALPCYRVVNAGVVEAVDLLLAKRRSG